MTPETRSPQRRFLLLAGATLGLLALGLGCGLDVSELPENRPPEFVGTIAMDPPPSAIAPLDSFTLSISTYDADQDPLFFQWSSKSGLVNLGSWVEGETMDSIVVWIAPENFTGIDLVTFEVRVSDFDQLSTGLQTAQVQTLDVPVDPRSGSLRVRAFDLDGNPAQVRLGVMGLAPTENSVAEHLFEEVPWGLQVAYTVDSEEFYGSTLNLTETAFAFVGYPETLYIQPQVENLVELVVAPKSLMVIPGVRGDTLRTGIQWGIDYCGANPGLDTLLVRNYDHELSGQEVPGGIAALDLSGGDLTLAGYPGDPFFWLDASRHACDFGLYLEGNSGATRVENLALFGAGASDAYLNHASASFEDLILADSRAAQIFLDGGAGDTLRIRNSYLWLGDYGISLSGGRVEADSVVVDGHAWYGVLLGDGAEAALGHLTLVECSIAGLMTQGAGAVQVTDCLIARNGRGVFNSAGLPPVLNCNLFWDNPVGHYGGVEAGADDMIADPLFCDPEAGDWRVQPGSPALDSLPCAPVGALGGCEGDGFLPRRQGR